MSEKFRAGDRALANAKAPGDYEGRTGTVLRRERGRSEYSVQVDGDEPGPGCLSAWMLDRVVERAVPQTAER